MAREFALSPPAKAAFVLTMLLVLALPLAIIGVVATTMDAAEWNEAAPALMLGIAVVILMGAGVMLAMLRRTVSLNDDQLEVRATFYTLRVPVASLAPQRAEVVDLGRDARWRPRMKTNAFAVPGLYAGHFRGRPLAQKLFCLVTRRDRVLALPEQGGRVILLSLERPQALLDALQRTER